MTSWVGCPFFKRGKIPDALRAFGWILRNWDRLKGTQWLSRIDLFGSGRENFIGIRVVDFKIFVSFSKSNGYRFHFCPYLV